MSGEKPFGPENVQNIDMKAIEARMTSEQLAKYQADRERDKIEAPLREARANIDYKKSLATDAVKANEIAARKEQKANNKLLCLDIADAINKKNTEALDFYVSTYLKDKVSFKEPDSIEEIQDIFNQLSNKPEELLTFGQPESPRVEMCTAYCEVPAQNEKTMVAITVTVDYTYNAEEPLVTFTVSKAPMPKKESVQAVAPLNKPKKVGAAPSILGKAFAYGKKLFGLE